MLKPVGIQSDDTVWTRLSLDDTVRHCWKTRQCNRKELNPSKVKVCWQTYFQPVTTRKVINSWWFSHVYILSNQNKQRLSSCFLISHFPHRAENIESFKLERNWTLEPSRPPCVLSAGRLVDSAATNCFDSKVAFVRCQILFVPVTFKRHLLRKIF